MGTQIRPVRSIELTEQDLEASKNLSEASGTVCTMQACYSVRKLLFPAVSAAQIRASGAVAFCNMLQKKHNSRT